MKSITREQINTFLDEWNRKRDHKQRIYVSYDSTNKNCQAGDIDLIEYGKPKDDQGLPIFNLAIAYDKNNRVPLFYEEYPGSITDVSQFRYMVDKVEQYNYKNVGLILDRGYFSKDNIRYMEDNGHAFVIMVKGQKDLVSSLVHEHRNTFETDRNCNIRAYRIYGKTVMSKLYEDDICERQFHIYYNPSKQAAEREQLEQNLDRMKMYLDKHIGEVLTIPKSYKKYFNVHINKKGEFVKEVTWKDMLAGGMDAAFGYVTGSLKDVTFEIYAAEDIKAADGESSDYYKKDELVATITTDALGYARSEDLPLGKYYVKEKETADGYVLDGEIREVDLTYRDQNTPVVTYDEDWQNNRQKAKVTVVKKEKNTDRVLEGGVFALYTKNDILNAEGEVILKADTMIEQKATDQDGRIVFTADLPINGSYYVKEVQAPAGFVTTEEIKEFDFAYAGEEVEEVSFEFTYEDEPTTFEITKSDIITGEELPGAKLKVSDSEGNVVDEWTSGSTPHIIKELEVGKKYTLTETIPADGYATAESITFVVENTADIQKVEMQDDTTKILISKVDMTDGSSEVKGAKLYILNENQEVMESWTSGDQHHYVEKLPIGTWRKQHRRVTLWQIK